MTSLRLRSMAALVLVVAVAVGCKTAGSSEAVDLASRRPAPARAAADAPLLAHIPADTPYLVASLASASPGFWDRIASGLEPVIDAIRAQWGANAASGGDNAKLLAALRTELAGNWNRAGIESLGFSTEPRFAIYGLGLQATVVRITVKDDRVALATVKRIAAKAGDELPAMAMHDGRGYWREPLDNGKIVVAALGDNQLVFAFGQPAEIDAKLGLILGSARPTRSLADTRLVDQLTARHGVGTQLIGFADTRQLAGKAIVAGGGTASAACTAELDRLSAKLPRVVLGYSELSTARAAGALVFETSPDVVAELRGLKTEIPGLAVAMAGRPIIALAGGIDLPKAQRFAAAMYDHLKQLGEACQVAALTEAGTRITAALSAPLPELARRITGGAIAIDEVALGAKPRGRWPEGLEGVAVIASPDARALFHKMLELAPRLKGLTIIGDGKLHDFPPGVLPFPVAAGVGDRVIAVVSGDRRRSSGEQLLGARDGDGPLLGAAYDVERLLEIADADHSMESVNDPMATAMVRSVRSLLRRISGAVDVTEHGLAMTSVLELR